MKHKQTLAMLLAAAMVLSMPLGAYAQGTAEGENSTDSVQPYVADNKAPVLNSIKLSDETVNAGGTLTVTVDAKDDLSGIEYSDAVFINKANGRKVYASTENYKNPTELTIRISEHEPSGTFELLSVQLGDVADNYTKYHQEPFGDIQKLPIELSFTVTGNDKADLKAPELTDVKISDTSVNAGDTLTVTVDAKDDLSGIEYSDAVFINKANGRKVYASTENYKNPTDLTIRISEYEQSGTFELLSVQLGDVSDNYTKYHQEPFGDIQKLPIDLSFTVINDDPVTPPTQPEGNKPSRPGSSDGNNSANSSNGSGVVNYESEKPDPADKQAVKAYNFWQDAKSKIRKTAEGKTLRLNVPKEITNLPASVMETLRKENVSLRLNWNGKTITIPAGKAQPKQKLRIYWTMQTLEKLYNA